MYKGGCEWSHPEFIGHIWVDYNPWERGKSILSIWGIVKSVCGKRTEKWELVRPKREKYGAQVGV
jgi:hypothetical protein